MRDEYDETWKPTSAELLKNYLRENDFVTVPEAAEIAQVPVSTVDELIDHANR